MISRMTAMLDVSYIIPSWATGSSSEPYNVLLIGAGNVNFGSDEGPWNHSYRLEQKLGSRLRVVAVIDPLLDRTDAVLAKKRASFVKSAYEGTKAYKDIVEFAKQMTPEDKPKLIVIGSPADTRGSDVPGKDLELQLIGLLPGIPLFIEKPIAAGEIPRAFRVAKSIEESQVLCSAGYMLRYLKAVQMMKQIIRENNLTVMSTIACYACAYEQILKPDWWNKELSGGPVIEQGTHFCDLSRYFGGDVDIDSVQAHAVGWDEAPGKLSKIGIDESKIEPVNRIPRVTTANWKYKNGAVGTFTHLVALQGKTYACEIEVYCDGYLLKLVDPYNAPVLRVRRPGSDAEEVHTFEGDDPFFSEISNFIDVIDHGPQAAEILSSFEDACKTYELTWAIRLASERSSTYKK